MGGRAKVHACKGGMLGKGGVVAFGPLTVVGLTILHTSTVVFKGRHEAGCAKSGTWR